LGPPREVRRNIQKNQNEMVLRSSGLKQRIKSKLALHAMPQKAAAWFLLLNLMGSAEHHLMAPLFFVGALARQCG